MHEAFLDSCIFWAFVGPEKYEPDHHACVAIFSRDDIRRYTSGTVLREIKQSESRRTRLYSDMIVHFKLKKRPEEFDFSRFSRHVKARGGQILRGIRGNEADIEFLRRISEMESARMRAALSRIEKPLVPARKDAYFEDLLRGNLDIESDDTKVITDFIFWAPTHAGSKFLTGDRNLLIKLRAQLTQFLAIKDITLPTINDFIEPDRYIAEYPPSI